MDIRAYLEKHQISQAQFADRIGVSQGLVWQWMQWLDDHDKGTRITAEKAVVIETKTGGEVARHDLRPDLYPEERAA